MMYVVSNIKVWYWQSTIQHDVFNLGNVNGDGGMKRYAISDIFGYDFEIEGCY